MVVCEGITSAEGTAHTMRVVDKENGVSWTAIIDGYAYEERCRVRNWEDKEDDDDQVEEFSMEESFSFAPPVPNFPPPKRIRGVKGKLNFPDEVRRMKNPPAKKMKLTKTFPKVEPVFEEEVFVNGTENNVAMFGGDSTVETLSKGAGPQEETIGVTKLLEEPLEPWADFPEIPYFDNGGLNADGGLGFDQWNFSDLLTPIDDLF